MNAGGCVYARLVDIKRRRRGDRRWSNEGGLGLLDAPEGKDEVKM